MTKLLLLVPLVLAIAAAPPPAPPPVDFQSNHGPSIGYENINDKKEDKREEELLKKLKEGKLKLRDDRGKHPPALPIVPRFPPLKSSIGMCGKRGCEGIELLSTVLWIVPRKEYEYTYTLKNVGKKKTWYVGSALPDRAIGLSSDSKSVAHLYKLKPGKSVTIKVVHKDPPVEYMATIMCYNRNRHNGIEDWYKEREVTITGVQPRLYFQMSGGCNGWLPKGLAPKKELAPHPKKRDK